MYDIVASYNTHKTYNYHAVKMNLWSLLETDAAGIIKLIQPFKLNLANFSHKLKHVFVASLL